MQLIKVYSNKNSFRTVEFNPTGLNFIIAKQKNPEKSDDGKTYNGVGKSLLVRIINFCLGASKDTYTSFCNRLNGWEFYLDFKIDVLNFTVKRTTDDPQTIILNDEKYSIERYKSILEGLCFSIPSHINYLSFRSLVPFFLRPSKDAYTDCMKPTIAKTDYQKLLYNAFLIGLDMDLAERKYKLRKEQERIKELEKNFKEDNLLKEFFTGNKDIKLELIELSDQIKNIEENLSSYKVADDYHEIQRDADNISNKLFELNNEIVIIENNIKTINESIRSKPESTITVADLNKVYNEVKIYFSDIVNKTLHEVEVFYENIITSRIKRLSEQKIELMLLQKNKEAEIADLQKTFNIKMKYLGKHQALDVFLALSQKCSELKTMQNDLHKYQNLQSEYKVKERQARKELLDLSEITDTYLTEIEESTRDIIEYFRHLAKIFYPNNTAGLTIQANSGENQLAFSIEPRIESDASDGINNVKIFCYDLSILFKGKNHKMNFIFHDSRLFDSIDERQKTAMFKIISDTFSNTNMQYIASINQNQLIEIQRNMTKEEYKKIFDKNTILTLTDDNDSEKLLGIKVDIGNK